MTVPLKILKNGLSDSYLPIESPVCKQFMLKNDKKANLTIFFFPIMLLTYFILGFLMMMLILKKMNLLTTWIFLRLKLKSQFKIWILTKPLVQVTLVQEFWGRAGRVITRPSLTKLIMLSWQKLKVPKQLKKASVTPIHNWRGICKTSTYSEHDCKTCDKG